MQTTRYHLLSELPEPDYFELELEKIYQPPPTRRERLKKWARHRAGVAGLLTLSLIAAILYMVSWLSTPPRLGGLARPENGPLKVAELLGDKQGSSVSVGVAGSEISGVDGDDVFIDNGDKDVLLEIPGQNGIDSEKRPTIVVVSPTNSTRPAVAQNATQAIAKPTAPQENGSQVSDKPKAQQSGQPTSNAANVEQDNGQVSIQEAPPADKEPFVPVKATFYSGVEGPKSCRGHVMAVINLPKPAQPVTPTAAQCYNFPNMEASGCATFAGNKIDGCQASVYAETNCRMYTNTMAFMAEIRPVGGNWRSVKVQCGLPEPDPASLGKPPGFDSMSSIKDNDKAKGG